jgi:hypothetical protein
MALGVIRRDAPFRMRLEQNGQKAVFGHRRFVRQPISDIDRWVDTI